MATTLLSGARGLRGLLRVARRRRSAFRNVAPAAVAGIIVSVIVISVLNRLR